MATGTITRKEIIEDEALRWGEEYAKTLDQAIGKNKEFVGAVLALNEANNKLRASNSQKELLENLRKTNELGERAIGVWKEQDQLERQLISTKKKNELATEGTNKALVKERLILQETNKELKLAAREQLGMVSSYEKLNRARTEAQKRLADLLSAEKRNIAEIVIAQREFDKLDARVKAVDAAIKNYSKNIGNYGSAFKGLNGTMRDLMSAFGLATGLALFGTIMRDIFSVVRDFDRQLIAVGKTTGIQGEELKQFGREVVDLGQKLDGVTVDGLIQSAEVAGQLGVTGTANILKFSESIEKLKLTSNIISDEQVGQFAKFIEVSSDSFDNADRLASVITRLGNEMATTEGEVLANSTEIQKGIAVYNNAASGVLGLGAATSTLGSEAEASRSAIQTTYAVINNAIATGKNLEKVLKLTNMTQKELSDQFNKDGTVVFQKFVGGLAKSKKEGENLALVLGDLGITEKRAFTVVGALAANYGVLESAMASASDEYVLNAALNKEVEAASQSVASIVGDLRDEWEAYILRTNDANNGTRAITSTLRFLKNNLATIIDYTIKYGAVLLTAIGVYKAVNFVTATYSALKTAAKIAQIQFTLATGIGTVAMKAEAAAAREAAVAVQGLNAATTATPWGAILAILAAVVAAYVIFNDEMSKSEKLAAKIAENNKTIADNEKAYADDRDKNRSKDFAAIEAEIKLRKAKGEDSRKLDEEEIARKKEIIRAQLDVFNELKNSEDERTRNAITNSNTRIAQMLAEANAGATTGRRRDELLDLIELEREKRDISKASLAAKKTEDSTERKKLNDALAALDQDAAVKDAEFRAEEDKKAKAARLKRLKDAYEAEKKLNDDLFKLRQFRLQVNIDTNKELLENEKASFDDRLEALFEFQQTSAAKSKEAAENDLKNLGKYNEETGKFIRQLSNAEIDELLKTGNIKKGLTSEQLLIYEKYQRDMTVAAQKGEDDRRKLIDGQVAVAQKRVDAELLAEDTRLNQALEAQNRLFEAELNAANGNHEKIRQATENHERQIFEIKKKFALDGLKLQINELQNQLDANDAKVESERVSTAVRAELANKLANFKLQLSDLETSGYSAGIQLKIDAEKEFFERVTDMAFQLKDELLNFSNAIFEGKIANLDAEMARNNEHYDRLIELAGNDEAQKDLLNAERDRKNTQIEKKKRKVMYDQAVFNKIINLATITAQTAMAAVAALAPPPVGLGPVFGPALLPYIIGLGAVQAATILATPLPKYKDGRKDGPEEFAFVGDGYRKEVISGQDGSNPVLTPDRPTITLLKRGQRVHRSEEDYNRFMRASILTSFEVQKNNMNDFHASQQFEKSYGKELLDELKRNTEAVGKNKPRIIVNQGKIDIPHSIWSSNNIHWS